MKEEDGEKFPDSRMALPGVVGLATPWVDQWKARDPPFDFRVQVFGRTCGGNKCILH